MITYLQQETILKKSVLIFLFVTLIFIDVSGQVSNPRIPAEWEEQQAIVMGFKSSQDVYPTNMWNLLLEPYIKVAEACILEDLDFYIYATKIDTNCKYHIRLDTVFLNLGIKSPNIHIIPDGLINPGYTGILWARDLGMFCVFENEVENLSMYHFEGDFITVLIDKEFGLNSTKINKSFGTDYGFYDGGNFLTDGHGTFNVMVDDTIKVSTDYLHYNDYFGIEKSVLLALGNGHIDYSFKMLNEETFVMAYCPKENYDNVQVYSNNQEKLDFALSYIQTNLVSAFGREINIIPIQNAPAYGFPRSINCTNYSTYTNALIMNNTVLVPQYAYMDFQPVTDSIALEIYREAMPGYNIVGVNCSIYQRQGGAIHCLTHEIPAYNPIYIKHKWLKGEIENNSEGYEISATVKSNMGLEKVKLYWKTSEENYFSVIEMTTSDNITYVNFIPIQPDGTEISYYISATDNNQKTISKPFVAEDGPYKFYVSGDVSTLTPLIEAYKVKCYPNPTNNLLNIAIENCNEPVSCELINSIGLVIFNSRFENEISLNISNYEAGVYTLKIYLDEGIIGVKKILIK